MDLWTRLQENLDTDDESYETLSFARDEEKHAEMPVPFCCPRAAGMPVVFVVRRDERLQWGATYTNRDFLGETTSLVEVFNCPFCGTPLPGLAEKANPPPHLGVESDEFNCSVCKKRPGYCRCSHPHSKWEAENAPPVFSVAAFLTQPPTTRNQYHDILAVSRKHDPNDLSLPGGKIDPGETPEEAMVRELLEETGLIAEEYHLIFDAVDEADGKRCQTFRVTKWSGAIGSKEAGVIAWVGAKTLVAPHATFREYNYALINRLDSYWLRSGYSG